jgi:hypothetical protein
MLLEISSCDDLHQGRQICLLGGQIDYFGGVEAGEPHRKEVVT